MNGIVAFIVLLFCAVVLSDIEVKENDLCSKSKDLLGLEFTIPLSSWCIHRDPYKFPNIFDFTSTRDVPLLSKSQYRCSPSKDIPSQGTDLHDDCEMFHGITFAEYANEKNNSDTHYFERKRSIYLHNIINKEMIDLHLSDVKYPVTTLKDGDYNILTIRQYSNYVSVILMSLKGSDNVLVLLRNSYTTLETKEIKFNFEVIDVKFMTKDVMENDGYFIVYGKKTSDSDEKHVGVVEVFHLTENMGKLRCESVFNYTTLFDGPVPSMEVLEWNIELTYNVFLVVFYDNKNVWMFIIDPLTQNRFNGQSSELLYDSPSQSLNQFYRANDGENINIATIYPQARAFTNYSQIMTYYTPSKYIWLVLGIEHDDGRNELRHIQLQDYGFHKKEQWDNSDKNPNNPRLIKKTELCENRNFFRHPISKHCEPYPTPEKIKQYFPEKVVDIVVRETLRIPPKFLEKIPLFEDYWNSPKLFDEEYAAIFVAHDDKLRILGTAAIRHTLFDTYFDYFNEFTFLGPVRKLVVASNAQHVAVSIARKRWELESLESAMKMCDTLGSASPEMAAKFPATYKKLCKDYKDVLRYPALDDFIQYIGQCSVPVNCLSFHGVAIAPIKNRYYLSSLMEETLCPKGYYCNMLGKHICPKGTICPRKGMVAPEICTPNPYNNATCFGEGLTEPMPCPAGTACPKIFLPPFPSPAGYYSMTTGRRDRFVPCKVGDYCGLGRSDKDDRSCVRGGYCTNPKVVLPKPCSFNVTTKFSTYCPEGSSENKPCPAGNYCLGPLTIYPCNIGSFCPNGSGIEGPCPAGYYCPSPSEKYVCPSGHFCKASSVLPTVCPFISYCPEKSKSEAKMVWLIPFLVVFPIAMRLIYWWVHRRRMKSRKEREKIHLELSRSGDGMEFGLIGEDIPHDSSGSARELAIKKFRLDLEFEDLGLKIKRNGDDLYILKHVNGTLRSGRVTAVMGPSGAGKSTFLTRIKGTAPGVPEGTLRINGNIENLSKYKKIIGFVPQEDVMIRNLTVKENLMHSALLRLPSSFSRAKVKKVVERYIDLLDLYKVRHSIIGDESHRGISGGQRKRVNIGLELVSDPTLLFLDEPTSGLDSSSSQEVCRVLRDSAALGLTVAAVVHQPRYETFMEFDDVVLLAPGGRVVYIGPVEYTTEYFETLGYKAPPRVNPADYFMDVISGTVLKNQGSVVSESTVQRHQASLVQQWVESGQKFLADMEKSKNSGDISDTHDDVASSSHDYSLGMEKDVSLRNSSGAQFSDIDKHDAVKRDTAGIFSQLLHYTIRDLRQQKRNWFSVLVTLALLTVSGILIGALFRDMEYRGPIDENIIEAVCPDFFKAASSFGKANTLLAMPQKDPFSFTTLALALTAATAGGLGVFGGNEKPVFWRESSSGTHTFSYFFGKDLAQFPTIFLYPLFFTFIIYAITVPKASFFLLYAVYLLVWYNTLSIGYVSSIALPDHLAAVGAVVVVLLNFMLSGMKPSLAEYIDMGNGAYYITFGSCMRWSLEVIYLIHIDPWKSIYPNYIKGIEKLGFQEEYKFWGMLAIFLLGVFGRVFAVTLLHLKDREKRK